MSKPPVSLFITDLDNTIFDWVDMWYASFSAMLNEVSKLSGIDPSVLEPEFKAIHQKYGTSEYAFSIEQLPSLRAKHPGENIRQLYDIAVEAYRAARTRTLRLYPTVFETLHEIKARGTMIAAYTESKEYYTHFRLLTFNLDGVIDYVYSPPDHELPDDRESGASPPPPRLSKTIARHTPPDQLKPQPIILREIIDTIGGTYKGSIYLGDSKMKDVVMAQTAEVADVWAKYGIAQQRSEYELLRRVTHWTDADVEREKRISAGGGADDVEPTYTLENNFAELLSLFNFVPFASR